MYRDRDTDRDRDRQTDTDRQVGSRAGRQTVKQTDKKVNA